jgi:hypothetical protein
MNFATRFVRWLYGDVEPEPVSQEVAAHEAVLRVIEASLRNEPGAWQLDDGRYRLYHERADYSIWVANKDYGLGCMPGRNAIPNHSDHPLETKWQKRLWAAAKPILDADKAAMLAAELEATLARFERPENVVRLEDKRA